MYWVFIYNSDAYPPKGRICKFRKKKHLVANHYSTHFSYMTTSLNGNICHFTGLLCREFIGHRWIPRKRPVTRNFDVSFNLRLNQQLSKQWIHRWFETPSHSLWRHCNETWYSETITQWWDFCLWSFVTTFTVPLPNKKRCITRKLNIYNNVYFEVHHALLYCAFQIKIGYISKFNSLQGPFY